MALAEFEHDELAPPEAARQLVELAKSAEPHAGISERSVIERIDFLITEYAEIWKSMASK